MKWQLWHIPAGRETGSPIETGTYEAMERKMDKLRAKAKAKDTGDRYYLGATTGA